MMEIPLFLRGIVVITGKNMRLYYTKPPVLMFGLLFPLFMFFAFFVGRHLDLTTFFPAFLAMMLFFTASSVGPLITPWEKREKTYERLLSYPVTQDSIILGDVVAGAIFGIGISLLVWIASVFFIPVAVMNIGIVCPRIYPWHAVLCRAGCPAGGAGIRQPAQCDDLLEPDPVPAHLHLRDIRPASADAGHGVSLSRTVRRSRTLSICSMRPCPGHQYFPRSLTVVCSSVSLPGLFSQHGSSRNGI